MLSLKPVRRAAAAGRSPLMAMARPFRGMLRRRHGGGGGTIAAVGPPPPRQNVAVCSTASVGCINHNVWRIYACYLYRAVFTLYRKKIIESSRGLRARELVSFAAFLLHKLYFIIFTAMLRFRDGNSSENFIPRGIEESRNSKITFLGDRGI